MSDQTLWELAQSLPHERINENGDYVHTGKFDPNCHRCQLEQWAQDTAAQWIQNAQDHGQRNKRENEIAWSVTEAHVANLGVPEEE